MLLPVLRRIPIHITAEYSPEDERAVVTASYGGDRFDPAEGENRLSYTVLKKSVEELSYTYNSEAEYSNTVRVLIREKHIGPL